MKIGYFKIFSENKKYVGGIMIADERGIPMEFKYTEPVEPTKIQEVLYGEVLEKYLREEVIMGNLVSKLENKPDIYIINDVKNLYLQEVVKEDVAVVRKTQIAPMKDIKTYKFIKENEAVAQVKEGENPVVIMVQKENKEEIIKKVIDMGENTDLTEPLGRVEEALELICRGEL